ncbi:MAG: 2-oxoacid:ferredoxin oxidoreductase subunit beta [Planctomycetes bacterium]|nr:2-oxoacid:ferredoxin oxidoreductase subunit beta [Planctomycetota bacterium]
MSETAELTRKDFVSDQDVRWCPGCGDYAILSTVLKVLPSLGVKKEDTCFISGIGCSSRFPYYADTFGFHTVHGRAPTIATGVKVANPDLSVWMVTGDGDGFSIGGNHMMHVLRRNLDINILLFNNSIYGLTKGQYSPTSKVDTKTKTSPMGSIDHPIVPAALALGAEASFIARTTDIDVKHMETVIRAAAEHKGTSFVEILQNCVIFNDNVHKEITQKDTRSEKQLILEHGQPLLFGVDKKQGIAMDGFDPMIIDVNNDEDLKRVVVHDAHCENPAYAQMLSRLYVPDFPVPLGVLRSVKRATYDDQVNEQVEQAQAKRSDNSLNEMIRGFGQANIWSIEE